MSGERWLQYVREMLLIYLFYLILNSKDVA